jgi:2-keto-4-pentenoate hydratase/2-oxohepta-3-ene-1,7-dioic acid hydratase (catechol pathway)
MSFSNATFLPFLASSLPSSDHIFNVRQIIAFLSQGTTLEPGSIILTGTPKGVGYVQKPPVYLKDGDRVSVWIGGGIGSLVNNVTEEESATTVVPKL